MLMEDGSLGFLHFENKRENKRFMVICFPASLLLCKSLLVYSYVFSVEDLTKAIQTLKLCRPCLTFNKSSKLLKVS
jgi:hypothetical protein